MKWVDSNTETDGKTDFSLEDLRIREPDSRDKDKQEARQGGGKRGGDKKKRLLVLAAVSALVVIALGTLTILHRTGAVHVNVAVVAVEGAERAVLLTAGGHVRSKKTVTLSSKIAGQVVSLRCDKGDSVRAGDILATIDSRELEAQLAQDEATYADAKSHLERIQNLFNRGVVAKPDFDSAETRLKVTEGRLQATRTQLSQAVIRSPFSGIILRKHVEQGELVFPGIKANAPSASAIVTIADDNNMEVEADINETDIHSVRARQPVDIVLDAFPEQSYHGTVKDISPIADRQKNTIQVVVAIERSDEKVRPEMSAKVSFMASPRQKTKQRLLVPGDALTETAGESSVFVVQGDRVLLRKVRPGQMIGTQHEILEGLNSGETVVTKSERKLKHGEKIFISQSRQGGE